jgi:transposase
VGATSETAQRLALRARIVLGCAEGPENRQVARQLHITDQTVCKWRERFRTARLEGLADERRPGAPRKISDAQVEGLIRRTLEAPPPNASHWSTRTMAQAIGMSQSAVSRIWRAFSLQPHRVETFKLSADPFFVEKVRDVVGLYLEEGKLVRPPVGIIARRLDRYPRGGCRGGKREQVGAERALVDLPVRPKGSPGFPIRCQPCIVLYSILDNKDPREVLDASMACESPQARRSPACNACSRSRSPR